MKENQRLIRARRKLLKNRLSNARKALDSAEFMITLLVVTIEDLKSGDDIDCNVLSDEELSEEIELKERELKRFKNEKKYWEEVIIDTEKELKELKL